MCLNPYWRMTKCPMVCLGKTNMKICCKFKVIFFRDGITSWTKIQFFCKFDVPDMTVSSKGCKKHVLLSCHAIVSVIFMAVVFIIQVSLWPFCLLFKISVYGHHAHCSSLIMEGLRCLQNRFWCLHQHLEMFFQQRTISGWITGWKKAFLFLRNFDVPDMMFSRKVCKSTFYLAVWFAGCAACPAMKSARL